MSYRVLLLSLLALSSPASAEAIGTNPVIICVPGAMPVKDGELYKCDDGQGHLTTPHFGLSVWAPLVEPAGACASGYEQACAARDHGARPYQAFGGGR
jgi:hypothetical protein